jgi:hypothetical protein
MEAYIAENLTDGTVVIRAAGYPDVKIKRGQDHLFATPQEFFAFRPHLDVMVQAKLLGVKKITEKQAAKISTEQMEARRDAVKNDHITASPQEQAFEARKIEVKETAPETEPTAPVVDLEAVKEEIKALTEEFKTSTDKKRKDEIRVKVKELKAKL